MKTKISILILTLLSIVSFSQNTYITKNATIDFFSSTLVEDIKAINNQVVSFIKSETGEINFGVSIKSFVFENSLMQEHFNENYMESDKFPNAKFKGKITDLENIDFKKDGVYSVNVSGEITIHGVNKDIDSKAIFTVKDKKISTKAFIKIKPKDFEIEIPLLVREQIAKILDVSINAEYEVYKE